MNKNDYKYILVASHRRSGTHFLIDTLYNNFGEIKNNYINLDRIQPGHDKQLTIDQFKNLISNKKKIILKTHSFGNFSTFKNNDLNRFIKNEILPFAKIIHISRDGKDILNSLFFFSQKTGNRYKNFSEFLASMNQFDDFRTDLNRVEFLKEHKKSWKTVGNICKIEYESLKNDYEMELDKISKYLNLKRNKKTIWIEIKKYNTIQRGLRRIFPSLFMSTSVLPWKGVIGDWKNNFSEKDLKYYNSIMLNSGEPES